MSRPYANQDYSYHDNNEMTTSNDPQQYVSYNPSSRAPQSSNYGYQPELNAPPLPLHRQQTNSSYPDPGNPFNDPDQHSTQDLGYSNSRATPASTPGMDSVGSAAAGGIQATRGIPSTPSPYRDDDTRYELSGMEPLQRPQALHQSSSYASNAALAPTAAAAGFGTADLYHNGQDVPFHDLPSASHARLGPEQADSPYKRFSSPWDPRLDQNSFDPNDIEDDGDDGIAYGRARKTSSMLGSKRSGGPSTEAAAAGGVMGGFGGMMGRKPVLTPSGNYGPVPATDLSNGGAFEKSQYLAAAAARRRKKRWLFIILGIIAVLAIVAGAVVGGLLANRKSSPTPTLNGGAETAAQDDGNGDLDSNSDEIKKLLNNPNLHRVFPGMDYTPFNAQYPACLTNPPSQNNITRDIAVLSQLTKTIRLYGTDCNQTDMVLHSIDKLGLKDIKVWLGVWLDTNTTTNTRGMNAMYDILDRNGAGPFAGVIIGNEVLFRKDMTVTQLANTVTEVKSNFTSKKIDIPVAVADLGDNWKAGPLTQSVDVVMSNIHPFFAGVTADVATGWTWDFWQNNDVVLTTGTSKKNIISEVGWPSTGGNDCGQATCTSKTQGSIAGINEMNTFMSDFVCQSLKNGTDYFWFEAFDEPWKVQFNTPTEQWEDKWGLMDPGRNLKPGLKIPDCGGQTI